ncbi:MAG: sortase [Clostridiales bacterium]|nr:sortase [Clostridiales bacterium]
MKRRFLALMMVFFAAVFLTSGFLLVRTLMQNRNQEKAFQEMAALFPDTGDMLRIPATEEGATESREGEDAEKTNAVIPLKERIPPEEWKTRWEEAAKERFPIYQSLAEGNPDIVGWVRIVDAAIDYPVCQTSQDPEYYLHRDVNGADSSYGTPFLDAACSLEEPRSSLLIYGHHMKDGRMFATLQNYTDVSFYQQHPYIQFDTLTESGSYEIVAVLKLEADGTQVSWQDLLFPAGGENFAAAWESICRNVFYNTGVGVSMEDELLALVTCEYTLQNGRLMVIARRIF